MPPYFSIAMCSIATCSAPGGAASDFDRAKESERLPVVPAPEEVRAFSSEMGGLENRSEARPLRSSLAACRLAAYRLAVCQVTANVEQFLTVGTPCGEHAISVGAGFRRLLGPRRRGLAG